MQRAEGYLVGRIVCTNCVEDGEMWIQTVIQSRQGEVGAVEVAESVGGDSTCRADGQSDSICCGTPASLEMAVRRQAPPDDIQHCIHHQNLKATLN